METASSYEGLSSRFQFTVVVSILLGIAFLFNLRRPAFPSNTPKSVINGLPIVGSVDFFSRRWTFCRDAAKKSVSGNFKFWAGQYPVIGLSGHESRQVMFGDRGLNMTEGYRVLLGGSPGDKESPINPDYFGKRLMSLLKGNMLRANLPSILKDVRDSMEILENNPNKTMEPFETIYGMVFQLTMRTIGANEIADDRKAMKKLRTQFETMDSCGNQALSVLYPRLPTLNNIRRLIAAIGMYRTIDNIVKDREKTGRRETDALQFLLDQGDTTRNIIEFILGGLFAGLLNTGINAAWLVMYLSRDKYWREKVLEEIDSVANKYAPDPSVPLKEKLHHIPVEGWESEFPVIDLCLKDSIRLNLNGSVFRRNMSGQDIQVSKSGEVIPDRSFAIYHVGDVHYDPQIYRDPGEWDPSRYLPDRAEDKKEDWGWVGWGVGRHPCLGMRFAKLECFMLVVFWFSYFESQNVDKQGNPTDKLPRNDIEAPTAKKPLDRAYVKYWDRVE